MPIDIKQIKECAYNVLFEQLNESWQIQDDKEKLLYELALADGVFEMAEQLICEYNAWFKSQKNTREQEEQDDK